MSELYMMRHGETLFNVLRRKQGWCDSPLTERGQEQARRAGAWLREQGIGFDHAYSSPSERACDTLELACPGLPYERVKGLKEWYFGTFEGLTEDTNPPLPYGDFYVPFGGESEDAFRERAYATVLELVRRPGHERVLVVTHGAFEAQFPRAFGANFRDLSGDKRVGNCGIAIYDVDLSRDQPFTLRAVENPNA